MSVVLTNVAVPLPVGDRGRWFMVARFDAEEEPTIMVLPGVATRKVPVIMRFRRETGPELGARA